MHLTKDIVQKKLGTTDVQNIDNGDSTSYQRL